MFWNEFVHKGKNELSWVEVQKVASRDSRLCLYWYSVFGEPQSVLTFLKNGLKWLKDKAVEIIPKYGRTEVKLALE